MKKRFTLTESGHVAGSLHAAAVGASEMDKFKRNTMLKRLGMLIENYRSKQLIVFFFNFGFMHSLILCPCRVVVDWAVTGRFSLSEQVRY